MRISTNQLFTTGSTTMGRQQTELLRTQQAISSGRRMLAPSDDPIAASRVLGVEQSRAIASQFQRNLGFAGDTLKLAESRVGDAAQLMTDVRQLIVAAGNGSYGGTELASIATEMRGKYEQLLGIANSRDGSGAYLFSGYQDETQPFDLTSSGVIYAGDSGERRVQIGAERHIEVSASGRAVFEEARTGNGWFTTSAPQTNQGTGRIDTGSVFNSGSLTGHDYRLDFTTSGAVTQVQVFDETLGVAIGPAADYVPGTAIRFDGMAVTVSGEPKAGDQFDIRPSTRQSVFRTIEDAIAAIESRPASGQERALLSVKLGSALAGIDQASATMLSVQTAMGVRLAELESTDLGLQDQTLARSAELSRLQDLDYAEALSVLARQQLGLEAAQKTYVQITSLSLFKLL